MPGKYAHLIDRLPKLLPADAQYQDKVEEVKRQILKEESEERGCEVTWLSATRLAKDYREIRDEIDALEEQMKKANLRLEAISQMMINQFEVEDVGSMTLADGAVVRTQVEPYAQVKDKDIFRRWCIANGLERSLQLPWQSTNSITKERLLAGLPEPDGVEAHQKTKVVLKR